MSCNLIVNSIFFRCNLFIYFVGFFFYVWILTTITYTMREKVPFISGRYDRANSLNDTHTNTHTEHLAAVNLRHIS